MNPHEAPKCTACDAAPATVQILDLEEGSIVSARFLCDACAANSSHGASAQQQTFQLSTEILESLLGSSGAKPESQLDPTDIACPGCGMSLAEFRMRGRLGCARCYEVFRIALMPLLERVHDATCHRGRFPGRISAELPAPGLDVTELRNRLEDAIAAEQYEEAARLRDELEKANQESEGENS
ncbi:MAG: UvrB/UvrC motif-containing protein [Planctomycetes bacterium]|nr:UvrB/UvrC motif-containing protein [Planctomycetota bacterium]